MILTAKHLIQGHAMVHWVWIVFETLAIKCHIQLTTCVCIVEIEYTRDVLGDTCLVAENSQ